MTDAEIAEEAPVYGHMAELFAKAHPKTDADKGLVAAYWMQAIQGQPKWQAAELQKHNVSSAVRGSAPQLHKTSDP